jgi:cyclopropane fatty-acyl-phospholipid synthase-like methyltransferase
LRPSHRIAQYYDRNTRRFLAFGGGGDTIHRELWGQGVTDASQATRFAHKLLADEIRELVAAPGPLLRDFGCGVGGTLIDLAAEFPTARLCGITISKRQIEIARRAAHVAGLKSRCQFILGDFDRLQLDQTADFAFAIEAFVHSDEAAAFLSVAAASLRPGGQLIVIDDFLARDRSRLSVAELRWAAEFRRGWRVPSFGAVQDAVEAATRAGFELTADRDLSPLLKLNRPRDRAIAWLAPLIRASGLSHTAWGGNFVGGRALTCGLRAGAFSYRWLAFRKAGS